MDLVQARCQEAGFSGRSCVDHCYRSQLNRVTAIFEGVRRPRLDKRIRFLGIKCNSSGAHDTWKSKDTRGPVIGIDLGTSNSAVAVIREGTPLVIPLEASRTTIPSVIWLGKEEQDTLVGVAAQRRASKDPLNAFYSVKRLIGRSYASCRREAGMLVYKLSEGASGETLLWSPAREKAYSTEQVSCMLLRHLVQCATRFLGTPVEGAVIAVPAHFDEGQRQATLKAAELAGLKSVQLLQEPVAAAMAYGLHHNEEEEAILVFDLGGGTYDVSLLEGFEGIFEVLATGGDSRLGGDDWDKAIADWCLQKCTAHLRMEIRGQPELLHQLLDSARLSKVQLSTCEEAVVHVPDSRLARGPTLPLTRAELERTTEKLRAKLAPPLERLGTDCHVEWKGRLPGMQPQSSCGGAGQGRSDPYGPAPRDITQVVLVGSATRIPSVRQAVKQLTQIEPAGWVNPEECVALGAAIQAGILLGSVGGMELADGGFSMGQHGTNTGFEGLTAA